MDGKREGVGGRRTVKEGKYQEALGRESIGVQIMSRRQCCFKKKKLNILFAFVTFLLTFSFGF